MSNYLYDRRIELGLTQNEIAVFVGVSEATVSRWESGSIANMKRDKIYALSKILECTPDFIMKGPDTPTATTHDKDTIKSQLLTEDEVKLFDNYRKLNEEGQEIVCDYAEFLLGREKYKK